MGCLDTPLRPMNWAYGELMQSIGLLPEVDAFPTFILAGSNFSVGILGLTYGDSTHLSYQGSMYFSPLYQKYFDSLG